MEKLISRENVSLTNSQLCFNRHPHTYLNNSAVEEATDGIHTCNDFSIASPLADIHFVHDPFVKQINFTLIRLKSSHDYAHLSFSLDFIFYLHIFIRFGNKFA
jgi:hypothetical protein